MKLRPILLSGLVLLTLIACDSYTSKPTTRGTEYSYKQEVNSGQFGGAAKGQSFTPAAALAPRYTGTSDLELVSFSLFAEINGARNAPSASTYLNIYAVDSESNATFAGSSTNSVDTVSIPDGGKMTWFFEDLHLKPDQKYWAVFSATNRMGDFSVGLGLRTSYPHDVYPGGVGLVGGVREHPSGHDAVFYMTLLGD